MIRSMRSVARSAARNCGLRMTRATRDKARTLTAEQRYGLAQVISDTGLMFQFQPPTRDYEKAEMYYNRALEADGPLEPARRRVARERHTEHLA